MKPSLFNSGYQKLYTLEINVTDTFYSYYTAIPVGAQTLDGDMIVLCSFLHAFESTYKNIPKTNSFRAATLITKEKAKT